MKSIVSLSIIGAILFSSCGEKTDQSAAKTGFDVDSQDIYQKIAGVYEDTLSCPDCPGILTNLNLRPDSTFTLRERRLGADGRPAKANSLTGVFSFLDGNSKIKLSSAQDSGQARLFELRENSLIATNTQVIGNADISLEQIEKNMGKIGQDYYSYRLNNSAKNPRLMYAHFPGSDIVINKLALDAAEEAEKAVLAYYAMSFDSGCDEQTCALEVAMGKNQAQLNELLGTWISGSELPSMEDRRLSKSKSKLVMLMFNLMGNKLQVNYNVLSADLQMSHATDEFEVGDKTVKFLKKGAIQMQGRPQRPAPIQAKPSAARPAEAISRQKK